MNRIEFISRLETLLQDMPTQEREDAIAYYNDYFDDAGSENEQDVIASLGSPEKVAATIKAVQKDDGRDAWCNTPGRPCKQCIPYAALCMGQERRIRRTLPPRPFCKVRPQLLVRCRQSPQGSSDKRSADRRKTH